MNDPLHKTRTLLLCTALHGFTHLFQVALIPLYLKVQKDFGLQSEGQATFLVTALSIAYFLPSYPMGALADRVSRKKLLGFGLLINSLAFVLLAFAPSYWMAVLCVAIAGLGGSFYHPAATALVARLYPTSTGKALGKVGIGAALGFFIGPFYAGWRAEAAGWRAPVLELGIFGLIGTALFFALAKEQPVQQAASISSAGDAPKEKMFATPLLLFYFLCASVLFCFRDFAGSGMASLSSLFLQHARGFDAKQTGLMVSCIYLASIVSNPLFGHLSDKGRIRWTTVVLILSAICIVIFPHVSSVWSIILFASYGFFFMASYPMIEAALMQSTHDSVRGRVFGFFITIGGLLGNLSHWIVGSWVKHLGATADSVPSYFPIYGSLALCVMISLAGLFFLHALRKRDDSAQTPVATPSLTSET